MDISIDEIKKSIEHFGRVLRSYDIRDLIENVNIDFDSLNELGIDNKAKLVAVLTLGINDDNLKKIKEKIKERKITKIVGAKYDQPINNMCGAIVFIDKIGFVEFVLILSGGRLKWWQIKGIFD